MLAFNTGLSIKALTKTKQSVKVRNHKAETCNRSVEICNYQQPIKFE